MIKIINSKEAEKIIDTRKPKGSFIILEKDGVVGIDNTTNDAWTEEFKDLKKCLRWLDGFDIEECK